ncbi:UNVERIFIED_ORG: hypothetical protein QFZ59_004697 [Bacillus sp. B2I3]|nr:hypothetical protein [Bacillus sp. B2I3]
MKYISKISESTVIARTTTDTFLLSSHTVLEAVRIFLRVLPFQHETQDKRR